MDAGILGVLGFFVLGLAIGSFLNVVIHRLPIMMERAWERECAALHPERHSRPESPEPAFNLASPRSRCPHCNHLIRWYENVPLLSYAVLNGRCAGCSRKISLRYPLVELSTGLLFAWCAYAMGVTPTALAWSGFAAALLTLALIDWDTTLLPDDITLPLLWAGLIASQLGITKTAPQSALWGAVIGYLSLWSIYWLFKLVTGKEGMGYGDFKLMGALGAWFGWNALIPIILMSSVIGVVIGLTLKFNHGLREGGYVPFGPFLALAGVTCLIFGPSAINRFLGI